MLRASDSIRPVRPFSSGAARSHDRLPAGGSRVERRPLKLAATDKAARAFQWHGRPDLNSGGNTGTGREPKEGSHEHEQRGTARHPRSDQRPRSLDLACEAREGFPLTWESGKAILPAPWGSPVLHRPRGRLSGEGDLLPSSQTADHRPAPVTVTTGEP